MKQSSLKIKNSLRTLALEPRTAEPEIKKTKPKTDVGELVDYYLELRGWANLPKEEYQKRKIIYGRFTRPAKQLLVMCDKNLDRAKYLLDCVKRWAALKHLDWSIETVFKRWGEIEKDAPLIRPVTVEQRPMMSLKDIIKKMRQ